MHLAMESNCSRDMRGESLVRHLRAFFFDPEISFGRSADALHLPSLDESIFHLHT